MGIISSPSPSRPPTSSSLPLDCRGVGLTSNLDVPERLPKRGNNVVDAVSLGIVGDDDVKVSPRLDPSFL